MQLTAKMFFRLFVQLKIYNRWVINNKSDKKLSIQLRIFNTMNYLAMGQNSCIWAKLKAWQGVILSQEEVTNRGLDRIFGKKIYIDASLMKIRSCKKWGLEGAKNILHKWYLFRRCRNVWFSLNVLSPFTIGALHSLVFFLCYFSQLMLIDSFQKFQN